MSLSRRSAAMWCKFLTQAPILVQSQTGNLSSTLNQSRQWVVKKTKIVALGMLLGLGGGFWFINEVLTPQVAEAYTVRVNLPVNRQQNESYENLVQRAKAVALETTQQTFHQSSQVTDVSVIIIGQNQGEVAPVLSLQVSRPQWHMHMSVCDANQSASSCLAKQWVRYFSDARVLLGFKDIADTANQPDTAIQANPEQPMDSTSAKPETAKPTTAPGQTPETDSTDEHGPQSPDAIVPVEVPDSSQNSPTLGDGDSSDSPTSTPSEEPPTSVPDGSNIPNGNPAVTPTMPDSTVPDTQSNTSKDSNTTSLNTTPNQTLKSWLSFHKL